MRYWLVMLCALVSGVIGCSAAVAEAAVSVGYPGAGGWRGAPAIVFGVTSNRSVRGVDRHMSADGPEGMGTGFRLPVSRHIVAADQGFLSQWGRSTWVRARAHVGLWFANGMKHTPALVMGLFLLLLVPPLAVTGWFFRWLQPDPNGTRRLAGVGQQQSGEHRGPYSRDPMSGRASSYSRNAVLEIEGSGAGSVLGSFPLSRDELVVRIGREDDNEIQVRDKTVHRYHAAIDRSMDGGIAIVDMSSNKGNGVVVNGERVSRAQLKDGDRIGLGAVSLRFRVSAQ